MSNFELTKDYLQKIEEAVDNQDTDFLKEELLDMYPADIANILYELDGEKAHYVFNIFDTEKGADILSSIDSEDSINFIKNYFTPEEIAKYVNLFDSDDAVDLLNELPIKDREVVIANLENRDQARFILDLLHYPEDVAGGLMQKELVKVFEDQSVGECVEEIRAQAEDVEKVYAVYVVDHNQILKGLVSLRQIVLSKKNTIVSNVLKEDIVYVETSLPGEEVADLMKRYDLEAIPVVNSLGRLLGRITIDDIIDFISEKAEEDIQAMTGVTGEVEEDDSVLTIAKSRLPWLIIGVIGSLMAATVIKGFEGSLSKIAALAMFIPIMGSTGGNVGIQTSSLIVQSLAERSNLTFSLSYRLYKVIRVAIFNGIVIGILTGVYVYAIGEIDLFWVVCTSLLVVVLLASLMGTITPLILDKIGVNPAIASGPFITTANDLIGIGSYFLIAHFLLQL